MSSLLLCCISRPKPQSKQRPRSGSGPRPRPLPTRQWEHPHPLPHPLSPPPDEETLPRYTPHPQTNIQEKSLAGHRPRSSFSSSSSYPDEKCQHAHPLTQEEEVSSDASSALSFPSSYGNTSTATRETPPPPYSPMSGPLSVSGWGSREGSVYEGLGPGMGMAMGMGTGGLGNWGVDSPPGGADGGVRVPPLAHVRARAGTGAGVRTESIRGERERERERERSRRSRSEERY